MPAATARRSPPPDVAPVTCHLCGRPFLIVRDVLRELVDADKRPACGCQARPAPAPRPAERLTKADHCLLAVAGWETENGGDAPQPALVVMTWRVFPAGFGLRGFEASYPDSNRVVMELVKVVARGLLYRPREGHYRLTDAGRERVAQLAALEDRR